MSWNSRCHRFVFIMSRLRLRLQGNRSLSGNGAKRRCLHLPAPRCESLESSTRTYGNQNYAYLHLMTSTFNELSLAKLKVWTTDLCQQPPTGTTNFPTSKKLLNNRITARRSSEIAAKDGLSILFFGSGICPLQQKACIVSHGKVLRTHLCLQPKISFSVSE